LAVLERYFRRGWSIGHLERRTVLWPRSAVIVDAGGGDVGVAEPFLNLGDVGLMIERVGGGRRTQRMGADRKAELRGIASHQLIDAVRGDRRFQPPGAVIADRTEQRAGLVEAVAGGVQVVAKRETIMVVVMVLFSYSAAIPRGHLKDDLVTR